MFIIKVLFNCVIFFFLHYYLLTSTRMNIQKEDTKESIYVWNNNSIKLLYSDLRTPYRMVYSGKKARACRLESRYCRNTPAAARAPSGR